MIFYATTGIDSYLNKYILKLFGVFQLSYLKGYPLESGLAGSSSKLRRTELDFKNSPFLSSRKLIL